MAHLSHYHVDQLYVNFWTAFPGMFCCRSTLLGNAHPMCEGCGFMIGYLMWLGKLLSSYCVEVLALLSPIQLCPKPDSEIRVPFRSMNVMIPGSSHCQDRPVCNCPV